MKVMFYVQHLLGIGHLVRASRIAAAFKAAGHEVSVVSGGCPVDTFPPSGINAIQLPPVRAADQEFSALVQEDGAAVDETFRTRRAHDLIAAFEAVQPDCLLVEAFPFARRQMRFELLPLLEHVHQQPADRRAMVVSSVRDILQPKGHARDLKTVQVVKRYFDLVLVHGEGLAGFEQTFTQGAQISGRVAFTGLVGPAPDDLASPDGEAFDVVVSAGGGVVGQQLLQTAIAARPKTRFDNGRWLVVTGPNLEQSGFDALRRAAGDGGRAAPVRSTACGPLCSGTPCRVTGRLQYGGRCAVWGLCQRAGAVRRRRRAGAVAARQGPGTGRAQRRRARA
jgi:predicted glycosyltransferase